MSTKLTNATTQYLSFFLDDEIFAIDIAQVREVLDFTRTTKIPQLPQYIRGVINLRGQAVPVIDLKLKFGICETQNTINTCIIIVEVKFNETPMILGALADSVKEVFTLSDEEIEPVPQIGTQLNTEFLTGMGKHEDEFLLILDIDRVFSAHELDTVQRISMEAEDHQVNLSLDMA